MEQRRQRQDVRRNMANDMYYIDGSTVRKRDIYFSAAPAYIPTRRPKQAVQPEVQPTRRTERVPARPDAERRPQRRQAARKQPVTYRVSAIKARKSLAFDFKYTFFLALAMVIMIASCANMLRMENQVDSKKNAISGLQSEIREAKADNEAFENSISNAYTLQEIYDIAVNDLGMVYSQKGQIVYYDASNEDYVNQYRDVPSAD
ncbi:hypothetical protein SAMN04487934_101608 [Eubacterium ruminantium]|nr:hypothetical protein SAMN04487934_101608 [Eubacterium ruminantium]